MATNTYVALDKVTLGSAAATVTFSSISSAYTDLIVVFNGGTTSNGPTMRMTVNGDSGANYSDTALDGDGSSATSTRHSNGNYFAITNNIGIASTLGAQTTIIQLQNYSNSTTYKTVLFRANNALTTGYPGVTAAVGLWRSTAAINSISLTTASTTFLAGSTFSLYGVAAQPVPTAKATGGTIYYGADGYIYHKFTSTGTFTPSQALTADVLVVAGGGAGAGGGGNGGAGAGGAGGLLYFASQSLSNGTGYTCTVGAGGASSGAQSIGSSGNNSQFGALTAVVGGGYGGRDGGQAGATGGSGGGGGQGTGSGGSATSGQGYAGGNGSSNSGGGGGGAGSVGANSSGANGGNGGSGSSTYSSFLSTTSSGVAGSIAGGGGGGSYGATVGTATGGGGAGASGSSGNAIAGTSNTGGGGGGGGYNGSTIAYGGSGGSGIVIVRYLG